MGKRQIVAGVLALLMGFSAVGICAKAETIQGYEGAQADGKRQGFGINYNQGFGWWKGLWYDDKMQGMVRWDPEQKEGHSWIGFQNQGAWEGIAVETFSDGSRYILTMRNGNKNGLSVFFGKDGKVQCGIWEDDEWTGKEMASWTEGDAVFYAEKRDDADGGRVIYVYGDGDVYIGEYINGKREGEGSYSWPNGWLFSGNWKEDVMEGAGCLYYPLPEDTEEAYPLFFRGTWKADEMDGFGIIYYSDGSRRLGVWEDGQASGFLVTIDAEGTITPTGWYDGGVQIKAPEEIWTDESGTQFACRSKARKGDTIDGYGVTIYTDGNVYMGEHVNGVREGKGVYYWSDTDQYAEGMFENWRLQGMIRGHQLYENRYCYAAISHIGGVREGDGSCLYEDGSWYEGTWKGDIYDTGSYVWLLEDGSRDVSVYEDGEEKEGPAGVVFYPNSNYYGRYAVFEPGEYTIADLVRRGISINSISSIEVPEGYSVTVYQNGDLTGNSQEFAQDAELAATKWNDRIASFIVRQK